MKRITTEEFIEKAKEIHGNKYDYSKVNYKNKDTKICIICPEHGEFYQAPHNHIAQKQGCPVCGKKYAKECHKGNYQNFIKSSVKHFGKKYSFPNIENEYINNRSKITILCNDCGNVFTKVAHDHLNLPNGGCKKCLSINNTTYYSYEDLLKYNVNNFNIIPYEGKKCKRDKCLIECAEHGKYETIVSTIIKGKGFCKKCSGHKKTISKEVYLKRFNEKYGDIINVNLKNYKNTSSIIEFQCNKCGYIFNRIAAAMINNQTFTNPCPHCSKKQQFVARTKTNEEFINDVIQVYGKDEYDLSDCNYISSNQKVKIKCNKCNRFFEIEANSFLQGHGCPYHNCNSSIKEKEVMNFINENGFKYIANDRHLLNGKELDIYIFQKRKLQLNLMAYIGIMK